MKWVLIVVSITILGGLAFFAVSIRQDSKALPAQENAHIILTERGYEPREVTIVRGGTVTFSTELEKPHWPASNLHPTHEIYSEFDPKRPLESNEEWSFSFTKVGAHNFHDHIRAYFTGTIYVVEGQ